MRQWGRVTATTVTTYTTTATATAAATATTTTTPYLAKNVPPLACNNFDAREWILIFFGRNVTDKVGNQKTLYYATSNNLCFCTTWQNGENMKITFFSQLHCVTHTMHLYAVFLKEKLSSVMCLIAPNICWDSKVPINTVHWLLLQAWRRTTQTICTVTDTMTDLANTEHVGNRQQDAILLSEVLSGAHS